MNTTYERLTEARTRSIIVTKGDGMIAIFNMKNLTKEDIEFIKENKQEILEIMKDERKETKNRELQSKKEYNSYKREERNFNNNNGHC